MKHTRLFSPISIFRQFPVVFRKASITFAAVIVVFLATDTGFAQLQQIDTRVLEKIPLKVEFKNQESRDWVEELEIKVTNLSDKPICYLYINLFLDTKTIEGSQEAFSVLFGDSKRLYSDEPKILKSDPVIQPEKSMTFKIEKSQVAGWNLRKTLESFVEPRYAELSIAYVLYTDGSGIFSGGIRFKKKAKG